MKLPLFPNIVTTAMIGTLQLSLDSEKVELLCERVPYRLICTGTTYLQHNNPQCVKQGCGVLLLGGLLLRLRVKVGHRLLNLCDCDSVLSERRRQTNPRDF